MLERGILNPQILGLIGRVRHTNTLVIADRGFPFWPRLETVDISLVDDIPTVLQVLRALEENFSVGAAFMAQEFLSESDELAQAAYRELMAPVEIEFEPHVEFKKRVPNAVGLIRTADTTPYGNIILESA
jgi:D-ribose pyranase